MTTPDMRDPTTASARIYIGNLDNGITRVDIENHFQKHGKILGVAQQNKFAFVQFPDEKNAMDAIQSEHQSLLNGRKIIVRTAADNNRNNNNNNNRGKNRQQGNNNNNNNNIRDRSPIDDKIRGDDNNDRWGNNRNDNYNDFYGGGGSSGLGTGNYSNNRPQQLFPPPVEQPDHNDCEIIVVSKALTSYAESIEMHLKRLGLSVDLLFPNDDVPIGKVLANICTRGSLYAILVTPENEEHRSITVNILYGKRSELRNMPVEDAVNYLAKDFHSRNAKESTPTTTIGNLTSTVPAVIVPALKEKHPDAIQNLLNVLTDNRQLTVLQYDKIIKYLSERREMQVKIELGDDTTIPMVATTLLTGTHLMNKQTQPNQPPPIPQPQPNPEAELQQKILNILSKPSITASIPEPSSMPASLLSTPGNISRTNAQKTANNTPAPQSTLLYDPKVQKALDSLLQGKSTLSALDAVNMFKF